MNNLLLLLITLLFSGISYTQTYDTLASPLIILISDENYEFEILKTKDPEIFIKCTLWNVSDSEIIITRPYWRLNPYIIKIDSTVSPLSTGILNTVGYGIDTLKLKSGNKVDFDLHLRFDLRMRNNSITPGTYQVSVKYNYDPEKIKMSYKTGFEIDSLPHELEQLIHKINEIDTEWSKVINISITVPKKKKLRLTKNKRY